MGSITRPALSDASIPPIRRRKRSTFKRSSLGNFTGGNFTLIADDVRKSLAYQSMKPAARCVLIDMISVYMRNSSADRERLPEGFLYTPKHCGEVVSYNTFYAAVKKIVRHGFFTIPPQLQGDTVAQSRRFAPSTAWRTWTCPIAERAVKKQREALRAKCDRDSKRRVRYRQAEPADMDQAA